MDVKAALISGTKDQFVNAMAGPEGWDRWIGGVAITSEGPMPIMAGVVGTLGVVLMGPVGVNLHPHDSAEDALACWDRMAEYVQEQALMVDPRSYASQPPAALPVSTDDPTAVPFWL